MSRFTALVLALGLGALAPTASAVDLTGHYEGKLNCKGLDATGAPAKESTKDSALAIVDGEGFLVSLDGAPFEGGGLDELGKEEKEATVIAAACRNDGDQAGRLETLELEAKVSPGSGKTTVKLTSVRAVGGYFVCTGTYKRADANAPELSRCPVFYACVCSGTGGGSGACGNGGLEGDPGTLHQNLDKATLDGGYVNGNDTGWICVAQ